MWVANMTRPDLAYTAHTLAEFGDNLGLKHGKAVRKALQYLKGTVSLGAEDAMKLSGWVVTDHVTCPDTHLSVSVVMLGGGVISCVWRTPRVTATAASESEYVALAEIVMS